MNTMQSSECRVQNAKPKPYQVLKGHDSIYRIVHSGRVAAVSNRKREALQIAGGLNAAARFLQKGAKA